MKTTDGHEALIGHYYHLETGQQVILNEVATTASGKDAFMVTPLYEGEAMEGSGAGGYHHEITIRYEHEGEERLVAAIFKVAPLEKLCIVYAAKLREIEQLSLSVGLLVKQKNDLENLKRQIDRDIANNKKTFDNSFSEVKRIGGEFDALLEVIAEKRQILSTLEDGISTLKPLDGLAMISTEEVQRLRKRDYLLTCLESGGVDAWEWYSESLNDYRERYPED